MGRREDEERVVMDANRDEEDEDVVPGKEEGEEENVESADLNCEFKFIVRVPYNLSGGTKFFG